MLSNKIMKRASMYIERRIKLFSRYFKNLSGGAEYDLCAFSCWFQKQTYEIQRKRKVQTNIVPLFYSVM